MNNSMNEATLPNLLKRGQFSLEDYDYKTARQLFDQALNVDPESGAAYIGLAKAKARITRNDEFFEYCIEQYHKDNAVLKRARQFADEEWKAFFNRVDSEVKIREEEKGAQAKKAKKAIGWIAILVAVIIAAIIILPHIVFSSAEQLYKSGQYKEAYERAAQISSSGLGEAFAKGTVEKYAYAYLYDYIEQNGELTARISDRSTVEVNPITFSSGGTVFYFCNFVETNEYSFRWVAEIYSDMDEVGCMFEETGYTSTGSKSVYISHGDLFKADYRNGQSIEPYISNGSPRFSTLSALYDYGTVTIAKALSMIQTELGIPAEHLGFYSYK